MAYSSPEACETASGGVDLSGFSDGTVLEERIEDYAGQNLLRFIFEIPISDSRPLGIISSSQLSFVAAFEGIQDCALSLSGNRDSLKLGLATIDIDVERKQDFVNIVRDRIVSIIFPEPEND